MTIQGVPGSFSPGQTIPLAAGTWPVSVADGSGCVFDTVIIMPASQDLLLSLPAQLTLSPGSSGQINLSVNVPSSQISTVVWTPDNGLTATTDPLIWQVSVTELTTYQVTVTTIDGCTAQGAIQVDITTDPPVLFVPNAFSPNDVNGINDVFFPSSRPGTITSVKNMAIYDRWGNNLFLRADFPPDDADYGWNGRFRDKSMDPGVYIYVIEVVLPDGKTRVYKGDVTMF